MLGPTIGLGPAPAVAEWMGLPPLAGPYVLCVVLFGAAGLLVWRRLLPDPLAVVGGVGLPAAERPRFWDSAHLLRRSAAGRPKFGRSWPSRGPLKRAPPAPPGRHADTRRVRGVDNDAPPPRLMLFAVRNARPPLQASTVKSGLRERLPRRRAA